MSALPLRFPLSADHPLIVFLNWQIRQEIADYNSWKSILEERFQNEVLARGVWDEKGTLTSHEPGWSPSDHYYGPSYNGVAVPLAKMEHHEKKVRELIRQKLRLFGDVDLHGGKEQLAEIRQMIEQAPKPAKRKTK